MYVCGCAKGKLIVVVVVQMYLNFLKLTTLYNHKPLNVLQEYVYPQWAYILGWFIAAGPLVVGLILGFVHAVRTAKGDTCHKVCRLKVCSLVIN